MSKFVKSIAFAAVLAGASTGASAAIVTNGGFEDGLGAGNGWTVINLTGTTPGNGIQLATTDGVANSTGYGDIVPSYEGTKAAFFVDDNAIQSLSQFVSLQGGTTYSLNFALFGTESGASNPFDFRLTESVGLFTFSNTDTSIDVPVGEWTAYSYTFTAPITSSFYILNFGFRSGATPAKDVLLDGVSITAVPEPSTWAMMIGGLGLVGVALRRRKTTVSFA